MQFTFKKTIGNIEFIFTEEASDIKEFFRKVSFVSELPSVGPNGETDLVLQYRTTKTGDDYYSIVSKQADQELKLGQHKGAETLFVKGWEELYKPENYSNNQNTAAPQNQGLPSQAAPQQAPPAQATPLQQGLPTQQLPTQQAAPANNNQSQEQSVLAKYGLGQN